jgi:hypothetical protein
MSVQAKNLESARNYLQAIESGATGGPLGAFFAPGVEFVVFPNLLLPKGDRHKLAGHSKEWSAAEDSCPSRNM